jgi:hypothetical protein
MACEFAAARRVPQETLMQLHYNNTLYRNTVPDCTISQDALGTIQERSRLSDLFFSHENLNALQHAIRVGVFNKTGQKIDRQSDMQLVTVMRSCYVTYALNLDVDLKEQVKRLNAVVLDYAITDVVINMTQYLKYAGEVGRNPLPLSRSPYQSMAGTRTLELTKFF